MKVKDGKQKGSQKPPGPTPAASAVVRTANGKRKGKQLANIAPVLPASSTPAGVPALKRNKATIEQVPMRTPGAASRAILDHASSPTLHIDILGSITLALVSFPSPFS
eukprot:CAMPEP_0206609152 /NCGR_PEP_ID=MMETSP0325_2-20121206/53561_1 /ASSEMBLY_ACC=CAM_ASM_000347 /TAXON_ID=2866 /ORGANISM="Crypthecodinium cohnii, Strain Seligo" /LENGTH=107 /DNA_ID=CAMNT_0054127273 /DNA_START=10 /DNA_END=329 /DNA_ORIENTATION=-